MGHSGDGRCPTVVLPMKTLFVLAILPFLAVLGPLLSEAPPAGQSPATDPPLLQDARANLGELLAKSGITFDDEHGLCAISARVDVTNDLLEYLLVSRHGAMHESLFVSNVEAESLNAALLALGVSAGRNASWSPKSPAPSEDELRQGVSPYVVQAPSGDGFYLYVAWREGEELFFHRVEDLVRDLSTHRSMKRHRWVYLGSRLIPSERGGGVRFAAAVEGNLINIAFFAAGNTMLTAGLESCIEQTIWLANPWMLPPFESPVLFIFARERLEALPSGLRELVPVVPEGGAPQPR